MIGTTLASVCTNDSSIPVIAPCTAARPNRQGHRFIIVQD
jgi:hypothetical protein